MKLSKNRFKYRYIKEYTEYFNLHGDDKADITIVVRDDRHDYKYCDGILYELSNSGEDMIVSIDSIEHTDENLFYDDQVERYVEYISNGGILETFPVNSSELGGARNLEEICDYLGDTDNFDLLWELTNVKESKARKPLIDIINSLSYDSESYGIESNTLSSIFSIEDLDEYYGKNYLSRFDEEEIEDYSYYWEEEYYNIFKNILQYWSDNKEYTLTDMNHRFMAVKELGKKYVYIDPS